MDMRDLLKKEKPQWPNRHCDKIHRIKKPHDPEHISSIVWKVMENFLDDYS